jgi:hypothetical protein
MPRRQAEVEQGGHLHRLQQADGVEREALVLAELFEVLFTQAHTSLAACSLSGRWARYDRLSVKGAGLSCLPLQHRKGTAWSRTTTPKRGFCESAVVKRISFILVPLCCF